MFQNDTKSACMSVYPRMEKEFVYRLLNEQGQRQDLFILCAIKKHADK